MTENSVILFYEGVFDQEIVKSVISMTEKKLIDDNIEEQLRKKVFNILVEGLQNICKHQLKNDETTNNPFLIISKHRDHFNIITGNPVPNCNLSLISSRIEFVNSLDKEQLKEHYKKARLGSVISAVGGAGLGFIDMARKSGNKLEYRFYPINGENSFFVLNNKITNN